MVLVFVAKYWLSGDFGLYEDDYTRTPRAMAMDFPELLERVVESFRYFVDHGKPLHASLLYTLSFIGNRIAGLQGIYLIGYLIVATNAILFFELIRRLYGLHFAFLTSLAFTLYFADTTQALITHALGLQTSLTFTLLALHSFRAGKRGFVYLFALLVLINYEVPFSLFFTFPLIEKRWDRRWFGRFWAHAVLLGTLLALYISIRYAMGESRVTGLSYPEILTTPLTHMFQGPIVSLGTYFYRPMQAITGMGTEGLIATILMAPVLYFAIERYAPAQPLEFNEVKSRFKHLFKASEPEVENRSQSPANGDFHNLMRASVFGIANITLAYLFTFTVRAYAISGRETRVHLAAAIGAAILFAVFGILLLRLTKRSGLQWLGSGFLAGLFSLLIGFGFVVQHDYAQSWALQRTFWTQVVALTPDIEKDTAILIEPAGLEKTQYIDANTWNMPRVLNQIYTFPEQWEWYEEPRVYWLWPTWREMIWVDGTTTFRIDEATTLPPSAYFKNTQVENVIILEMQKGQLVRVGPELMIEGKTFILKLAGEASSPAFPRGVLYPLLVDNGG
jgi:hypothetical protein